MYLGPADSAAQSHDTTGPGKGVDMSPLDGGRVIRALSRASEPLNAVIRY
jgi:hypothetical protein